MTGGWTGADDYDTFFFFLTSAFLVQGASVVHPTTETGSRIIPLFLTNKTIYFPVG
jgi:hypothetical protein